MDDVFIWDIFFFLHIFYEILLIAFFPVFECLKHFYGYTYAGKLTHVSKIYLFINLLISLPIFIFLPSYLAISIYLSLYLYQSINIFIYITMFISVSVYISVFLSIRIYLYFSLNFLFKVSGHKNHQNS